jgi:hypothetical protein
MCNLPRLVLRDRFACASPEAVVWHASHVPKMQCEIEEESAEGTGWLMWGAAIKVRTPP